MYVHSIGWLVRSAPSSQDSGGSNKAPRHYPGVLGLSALPLARALMRDTLIPAPCMQRALAGASRNFRNILSIRRTSESTCERPSDRAISKEGRTLPTVAMYCGMQSSCPIPPSIIIHTVASGPGIHACTYLGTQVTVPCICCPSWRSRTIRRFSSATANTLLSPGDLS